MAEFKFSPAELAEIATYAECIATGILDYREVALATASFNGRRVGIEPNAPHRAQSLAAIRALAVQKGYSGPPLPEADPNEDLARRGLLVELMQGVPVDGNWRGRRAFYESRLATAPLSDPTALAGFLANLRAAYQPIAAAAAQTAPGARSAPMAQRPAGADPRCVSGAHTWGPADEWGWRVCRLCGLANVCDPRNPGAIDTGTHGRGPLD